MATSDPYGVPSGTSLSDRQYDQGGVSDLKDRVADAANEAKDRLSDAASDAKVHASEMAGQAKQKASELGRTAADTVDRNVHTAASKLESAASSLRNSGVSSGGALTSVAHKAADSLDATARYFRDYNTRDVFSGLEQTIRSNPGASLAAALAVGFLIGSALTDKDSNT